jgi:hypothetical protein
MELDGIFSNIKNFGIFLGVFLFVSCASASFIKVDDALERTGYSAGIDLLEAEKYSLYSRDRDAVLYFLDKGLLCHYAGMYEKSSGLLENGEQAIEAAFTKSISRAIGSYLLNDTVLEYSGEDYEDIYINAFNALNYYNRGKIEDALVEIRRMNEKLAFLSTKYDVLISELQERALEENLDQLPANPKAPARFSDSALARYLGMLFYRADGMYDDARIDRDALRLAFANAPHVYDYPAPASVSDELEIPAGMARLNVIAFSGLAPVKRQIDLRIPLPGPRWAKISLPEMQYRRSGVARIEVLYDDGRRLNLDLLEDMEKVAVETFKTRQNVLYLKSVIRALVKGVGSSALDAAAGETDEQTGLILELFSFAAQVFAEASEQADLRTSRYFPAKAYVGGINLEPGVYSFSIKYFNRGGGEIASFRYDDMCITERGLNLAEAVSFK